MPPNSAAELGLCYRAKISQDLCLDWIPEEGIGFFLLSFISSEFTEFWNLLNHNWMLTAE